MLRKLVEIARNNELKSTSKSLNQTQRNILVEEITTALLKQLVGNATQDESVYSLNEFVSCGRISNKTIKFEIDNEKVGFIPLEISVSIPNFSELSLYDDVSEYHIAKAEKERIKAEKEKAKAEKIKADEERRAKIKALKEESQ